MAKSFKWKNGTSYGTNAYIKRELDRKITSEARTLADGKARMAMNEIFAACLQVLYDEFGFGEKRLTRFKDAVEKQADLVDLGYVDWSDFKGNIDICLLYTSDAADDSTEV